LLSTTLAAVAGILVLSFAPHALAAAKFKTLYSFCTQPGCADGQQPEAPLLADGAGNVFGSTNQGGANGDGTIFELTGSDKTLHTLYSFCDYDCQGPADPVGNLVVDASGALYGITGGGDGAFGAGGIFKLSPNADRTKWKFRILYKFCSMANCHDGSNPIAGLTYAGAEHGVPYDGNSPLYGTTYGGSDYYEGAVYQFTPSSRSGKLKVLYSFCSQSGCSDGAKPGGQLILDETGNIYGIALSGGSGLTGVLFGLHPKGKRYEESVLYNFDGTQLPDGALIMDSAGVFYGTASDSDGGLVYKLVPNGTNAQKTVLYHFCIQDGCADGAFPKGGVVMDVNGVLYGATFSGGSSPNGGTIFKLKGSTETVLHSFCSLAGCADGANPAGGLVIDPSGKLLGTTENVVNGPTGGTVFQLNR
jgi:uncharacterized repeat protein (TIGR03803 family)